MKKLLSCLIFALLISGCVTTQKLIYEKNGDLVLSKTELIFPEKIDDFKRITVHKYDKEGNNVSIGYNLVKANSLIAATIYVYPAPRLISIGSPEDVVQSAKNKLFNSHYEAVKAGIEKAHKGSRLISEGATKKLLGEKILKGKYAKFEYEQVFAWRKQTVNSDFYLFQENEWLIKYRITYPKNIQDKFELQLEKILKIPTKAIQTD